MKISHPVRFSWIDSLRGLAIIAVVIDHAIFLFYPDYHRIIWKHLSFSVVWFIFLSGMTNALSLSGKNLKFPAWVFSFWSRRAGFVAAYIFGSVVTTILLSSKFNWEAIFRDLKFFSAQPPYYFFNLLIQLYLVFPILYLILKRMRTVLTKTILTLFIGLISLLYLNSFYPSWPFSPSGRILGGGYLLVFFLGMLYSNLKLKKIPLLIWLLILVASEWWLLQSIGELRIIALPQISWSLSLLFSTIYLLQLLRPTGITDVLNFLGRRSLVIYLFHFVILYYSKLYLPQNPSKQYLSIILAIILPAITATFLQQFQRRVKSIL